MYSSAIAKTIMIVDNSADIRLALGAALRGDGYKVIEAINGQDAINKLGGQKVSLIISDLIMPIMGGIAFVNNVKMMTACCATPIIILTTESDETKKCEGQAAGAKAWIIKPFRAEKLLDAVRRLCRAPQ